MKEFHENNPFKTPKGYFENLTGALLDTVSEDKLGVPQDEGFTVPEDYFEDLHKNVQHKLEAKETKVVQLYAYRKYYFVAASIAAIVLLVFSLTRTADSEVSFDALAASDIESYFDDNDYGLSSYEIAEILPVEALEINDLLENEFEEENLIEYLNEHVDDFDELNIEDDE